jgi:hypothetical protein
LAAVLFSTLWWLLYFRRISSRFTPPNETTHRNA